MPKKPEIILFAGPNGSGESTITKLAKVIEPYINADDIKRSIHCTNLEAAQRAEQLRPKLFHIRFHLLLKRCCQLTVIYGCWSWQNLKDTLSAAFMRSPVIRKSMLRVSRAVCSAVDMMYQPKKSSVGIARPWTCFRS